MKAIKTLSLALLLAVPHACAMTSASIMQDINDVEESQNPIETARTKNIIADQHGMTVYYLHTAIATRKLKAAQAFVDAKTVVHKDKKDQYPLDYALADNFTEGIQLLLKNNVTPLAPQTLTSCPLDTLKFFCKQKKQVTSLESEPRQWIKINTAVIENQNPERIQPLIDNDLVCLPMEQISSDVLAPYISALATLLTLSSQSKISISSASQQQVQHYLINLHAWRYVKYGYSEYACTLARTLSSYKVPIEDKDLAFSAYQRALESLSSDGATTLLDALKKQSPIDLADEWPNALAILDQQGTTTSEKHESMYHFIDRAFVILTLHPEMILDQKVANKIHDALNEKYYGTRPQAILDHVYDFTSDDRNPFRYYNPCHYRRQHLRKKPASNGSYTALPTSETAAQSRELIQQETKESNLYPSLDDTK